MTPERVEKRAAAWFLLARALTCALMTLSFQVLNDSPARNAWNRWYTSRAGTAEGWLPFANWDGQHYLLLADWGYRSWDVSQAFFPLYPSAVRLVAALTGDVPAAAFLVNLAVSWVFTVFFLRFARRFLDDDAALHALLLTLAFPTAFFLVAFYSEAFFLALLFAFLHFHARASRWALLPLLLLPLARGQAAFVLVALAAALAWRLRRRDDVDLAYEAACLGALGAGFALYLGYMDAATGSPWSGTRAQQGYVFGLSLLNCFNPLHFATFLATPGGVFAPSNGLLDKVFIAFMWAGVPVVARTRDPVVTALYVALVYFPATMGSGASYMRHALLAFPLLAIAGFSAHPGRRAIHAFFFAAFLAAQALFIHRFATNDWVA